MLTLDLNAALLGSVMMLKRVTRDQGLCDCLEASLHPNVLLNLMMNPLFYCKTEMKWKAAKLDLFQENGMGIWADLPSSLG